MPIAGIDAVRRAGCSPLRKTSPMLRILVGCVVLAASPMAVAQPARDPAPPPVSAQDARLLRDIARSSLAEIAAGKLALDQARAEAVRKFGQLMVDVHSKLLEEARNIAKLKGLEVPAELDPQQQAAVNALRGTPPERFDRAYGDQVIKDHQAALELARRASTEARDPNIKAFAAKASPHIEKHLEIARELAVTPPGKSAGAR
jgi:putative membrane protein